jgi:DNA-binding transcriptional ArsR family regulator
MLTAATKLQALARVGKALADPTRCRLLLALLDGPAYPAELARELGLSKATVSNHLACARGCGLVVATPEGRRVRYELADPGIAHALNDLLEVMLVVDDGSSCLHDGPPSLSADEQGVTVPVKARA